MISPSLLLRANQYRRQQKIVRNKIRKLIPMFLAVAIALFLVACTSEGGAQRQTFKFDNGDKVELVIDEDSGYLVETGTPNLIMKDGVTFFKCGFGEDSIYDMLKESITDDGSATVIKEETRDDVQYLFYVVGDGDSLEYDIVAKISGTETCALLASEDVLDEVSLADAFSTLAFRVK